MANSNFAEVAISLGHLTSRTHILAPEKTVPWDVYQRSTSEFRLMGNSERDADAFA